MAEGYTLKLETRTLGAVQIMNGLFYCALGFLCFALFVEEENREATGYIPVIVTLTYVFCSSTFFITSGSISVQAQKHPTKCKLIASMVMNILSACFSVLGIMILSIASLTYYPDTNEYLWSHVHSCLSAVSLHNSQRTSVTPIKNERLIVNWGRTPQLFSRGLMENTGY
ncbi:B-lymphocyte antigen CD20-like isoform X1 [Neofelis nebulosa]|uniref:B-lymphocyte antigen CD20-like isoform X1 n=1 Tax=Neofelis nebulosa TaxID=61452 RepID=UPI00272C805C|nr:B-lymphocyte antigen CD20-like isoform X1 [Neofelis nebulosa]